MTQEFKNQVFLIIGGTRGIGFAIADYLHKSGAQIVIVGRNKRTGIKAISQINPNRERIDFFQTDITDHKKTAKVFSKILTKYKKIDVLICSAGLFEPIGPFTLSDFNLHEKTINTNLIAPMHCCYLAVEQMRKRKKGKIILFSGGGIGGDIPLENASSYFVSKGGLALFSEVLAEELKPFNIQINIVSPGRILTDLTKPTLNMSDEILGKVLKKATNDLKKTGGQSLEPVLKMVEFLCSKKSDRLSGKLLSARWDKLVDLSGKVPSWKYTLRRIEGRVYKKGEIPTQ